MPKITLKQVANHHAIHPDLGMWTSKQKLLPSYLCVIISQINPLQQIMSTMMITLYDSSASSKRMLWAEGNLHKSAEQLLKEN